MRLWEDIQISKIEEQSKTRADQTRPYTLGITRGFNAYRRRQQLAVIHVTRKSSKQFQLVPIPARRMETGLGTIWTILIAPNTAFMAEAGIHSLNKIKRTRLLTLEQSDRPVSRIQAPRD